MSTSQKLLTFLSSYPEKWFSGNQLASQLELSRTAVWKGIRLLEEQGYSLESRHGLGYRLMIDNQLNAALISQELRLDHQPRIVVYNKVSSTNTIAKQMLFEDLKKPVVILANQQTAGRGRFDRKFYSPAASGIYMSIALSLSIDEKVNPGLLTTATAVAAGRAIKKVFHRQVKYKWVNDLILNNRKCGGILTEAITDLESGRIASLVIGIGLNLTLDTKKMPTELLGKAGAISKGDSSKRNLLIAEFINFFFDIYRNYRSGDFLEEYRRHSIVLGKKIAIVVNRKKIIGKVEKINSQGAILLKNDNNQLLTISSGEIIKLNLLEGKYHE
ncbi:biotin--[acetyl-CoA-carboxylase] ligase [Oenococcus oeni]|uniref:biotin--[acetyl-CoA-carboxylase] ligase n=1 Tax=Oenococcus oeni TaxID=1247 RepID=UPI00050E8F86|nr:biotin--[acetyl-CoA-carboxylase] ligase [Oenococcus oeni]KGI06061.1 biotin operon repressor [Oenococcus oeni IOEB_L40_4]